MKAKKTFTKEQMAAMRAAVKKARANGEYRPHGQIQRYQVTGT